MNFHVKVCLGVVILVLLALGAVFLLSWGGEEAAIEKLLEGAGEAAERGDTEAFVGIVSRDFKTKEYDYDGVVRKIRAYIRPENRYPVVEVRSSVHVRGQEADATARAIVGFGRNTQEALFRLRLRKEAGGWKIISAEEIR